MSGLKPIPVSHIPIDARNGISDPFGTVPVRVEENKPSGSVEDLVFKKSRFAVPAAADDL